MVQVRKNELSSLQSKSAHYLIETPNSFEIPNPNSESFDMNPVCLLSILLTLKAPLLSNLFFYQA